MSTGELTDTESVKKRIREGREFNTGSLQTQTTPPGPPKPPTTKGSGVSDEPPGDEELLRKALGYVNGILMMYHDLGKHFPDIMKPTLASLYLQLALLRTRIVKKLAELSEVKAPTSQNAEESRRKIEEAIEAIRKARYLAETVRDFIQDEDESLSREDLQERIARALAPSLHPGLQIRRATDSKQPNIFNKLLDAIKGLLSKIKSVFGKQDDLFAAYNPVGSKEAVAALRNVDLPSGVALPYFPTLSSKGREIKRDIPDEEKEGE